MDYQTVPNKSPQLQRAEPHISREDMIRELRRQASILRDEGHTAADFCLAEQYEITADMLN